MDFWNAVINIFSDDSDQEFWDSAEDSGIVSSAEVNSPPSRAKAFQHIQEIAASKGPGGKHWDATEASQVASSAKGNFPPSHAEAFQHIQEIRANKGLDGEHTSKPNHNKRDLERALETYAPKSIEYLA
jgi:hypothetical protein